MNLSTSCSSVFASTRAPRGGRAILRLSAVALALVFSLGISVASSQAQDVAEAAKQERARKEEARKKSKHVYTDEDLKRAQILTPEDRAQLEAARKPALPASEENSVAAASNIAKPHPVEPSLGEVARINRKKKELRTLEHSEQFSLPLAGEPRLASPKPAPPNTSPPLAPIIPLVLKSAQSPPLPGGPVVRRSPFERPRNLYAAPRALWPTLRPLASRDIAAAPRPATPSQPRFVSPRATPVPAALVHPSVPIDPEASPISVARNSVVRNAIDPSNVPTTVIVVARPGDSLWKLAEEHLGRGQRWRDLVAANPHLGNGNHIRVGEKICMPSSELLPTSDAQYRVQPGDTLSGIAKAHFHRAEAAGCVAAANPELPDADHVRAGQSLLLPVSCAR